MNTENIFAMAPNSLVIGATKKAQDITAPHASLVGQFVKTPLSWWDDGKLTGERRGPFVIGKIEKLKVVRLKAVAEIQYVPTNNEAEFLCEVLVDVVKKMLRPSDWAPLSGSFHYEQPDSDDDASDRLAKKLHMLSTMKKTLILMLKLKWRQ